MNLSEQFCGIKHAPLADKQLWCERLKQRHPMLTNAEIEREWHEQHAQYFERFGFVSGSPLESPR